MKTLSLAPRILLLVLCLTVARAQETAQRSPVELFAGGVQKIVSILEPAADGPQTFSARLEFLKAGGAAEGIARPVRDARCAGA